MLQSLLRYVLFMLYATFSFSQQNGDSNVLLKKASEELYSNPEQTIKISEHLVNTDDNSLAAAQANLLIAKGNLVLGNYTLAIKSIQTALTIASSKNDKATRIEILLLASEIYSFLDLFEIAKPYVEEAQKLAAGNRVLEKKVMAYQLFCSNTRHKAEYYTAFLNTLSDQDQTSYAFITKGTPLQITANAFLKNSQLHEAAVYYQKSMQSIETFPRDTYWKIVTLLDFSSYYFERKEYSKAIALLDDALKSSSTIKNPFLLKCIYQKLSENYLVTGNNVKFQEFKLKDGFADNDFGTETTVATNYAFELLQKNAEIKSTETKALQEKIYWVLGILAVVLLLIGIFMRWLHNTRIKHATDIVNYLKLIRKSEENAEPIEKVATKNLSIPKETEDMLLSKLMKFEVGKKYLNKEISLALMATQFDTNTKYLSEVINKYKGKNFNGYINELRINYIVKKLKTEPKYLNYKVSYLAEECGFSSHSSFSAVFKNISGITPNVFIKFLTDEIAEKKKFNAA